MNFRLMAAAAAGVLTFVGTATAIEPLTSASTLRALGAQVNLAIGTAAVPDDLTDPKLSPKRSWLSISTVFKRWSGCDASCSPKSKRSSA